MTETKILKIKSHLYKKTEENLNVYKVSNYTDTLHTIHKKLSTNIYQPHKCTHLPRVLSVLHTNIFIPDI